MKKEGEIMKAKIIIKNALKENKGPGSRYLLNILKNEVNYQENNFSVTDVQPELNRYDVVFKNGIVTIHISVDKNTFKLISTYVSNIYVKEPYVVQNRTLDIKKLFNYLD